MDAREFVAMTKQYAMDDVVEQVVKTLKAPRLPNRSKGSSGPASQWIEAHSLTKKHRSEWFNGLTEDERRMIRDILADCAERVLASFFTLLDGVGGSYEGVFEIAAIDSMSRRNVLNPENAQMLHDIFSEVCEEGRPQS
jgi:hypothetical protein